jgi:hypothetical protein
MLYDQYFLQFSSNRNSLGTDYDIVGKNVRLSWDQINGGFSMEHASLWGSQQHYWLMQDSINTDCNEFGPYAFGYLAEPQNTEGTWIDLLLYANNCTDNFDIHFIYAETETLYMGDTGQVKTMHALEFINTQANELYPTFFGEDISLSDNWLINPQNFQKVIYCSDMSGEFEIYEVDMPTDTSFLQALKATQSTEPKALSINAAGDDKCPFVFGNILVFTSNRSGGYGGFDLYYSRYENGDWTEATNFGDQINTEHDEYRPIITTVDGFNNSLMIFSSNRPGGKGGFDLYYTGISAEIQ